MSSSAQSSEARPFLAHEKIAESPLRRADEDICPYVVCGGLRSSVRFGLFPATETSLQLSSTHSAPAALSSGSLTVVRKAITVAPAALPARMPAGTSSTTTHSPAEKPRTDAPFR